MLLGKKKKDKQERRKRQRMSQNEMFDLFKLVRYRNPDCLLNSK